MDGRTDDSVILEHGGAMGGFGRALQATKRVLE